MERLVSLTSFPARIGGVKSTIDSVKRDGNVHVVLTLSDEEFPDHVIPDTGADEIIWVPKNIGPFKKVLYTMKKYPDEPVISVDDDVIYNNVVDLLWQKHLQSPDSVITNFPNMKPGNLALPNGYCTLYPAHSLAGALDMLTDNIVKTKNDDTFYGLILMNNQIGFRYLMRKDVAVFREGDIGLHLLLKYHGNEDVKKIVADLYRFDEFHPTDRHFLNRYDRMFCMKDCHYNKKVFDRLMRTIESDPNLTDDVNKSIEGQQYYFGDVPAPTKDRFDEPCRIMVSKKRTLRAARILCKRRADRVAILNFASATRPGGGVTTGSNAQEECLCRTTTLYKCLTAKEADKKFYQPHRDAGNPLHNDDIIFTPDVVLITNDHHDPLPCHLHVDVISCSAPNLRPPKHGEPVNITDEELYNLHVSRARQILNVAALHEATYVVLGAFGCGAFMNDPNIVAKAYAEVIKDYMKQFKRIEFAIFCKKKEPANYIAFKTVLNGLNIETEEDDDDDEEN